MLPPPLPSTHASRSRLSQHLGGLCVAETGKVINGSLFARGGRRQSLSNWLSDAEATSLQSTSKLLSLLAAAATVPHPAVAGLVTPCAVNAKLGAKLNATTGLLQGKRKLAQFSGESLLACLGGEAVRK